MKMSDIDGLLRFGGLALALTAGACADAEPGDEGDEGPAGGKGDDASEDHIGGANPIAIWLKTGAQWNEDNSSFTIAPGNGASLVRRKRAITSNVSGLP